jgi:hypothetical protein
MIITLLLSDPDVEIYAPTGIVLVDGTGVGTHGGLIEAIVSPDAPIGGSDPESSACAWWPVRDGTGAPADPAKAWDRWMQAIERQAPSFDSGIQVLAGVSNEPTFSGTTVDWRAMGWTYTAGRKGRYQVGKNGVAVTTTATNLGAMRGAESTFVRWGPDGSSPIGAALLTDASGARIGMITATNDGTFAFGPNASSTGYLYDFLCIGATKAVSADRIVRVELSTKDVVPASKYVPAIGSIAWTGQYEHGVAVISDSTWNGVNGAGWPLIDLDTLLYGRAPSNQYVAPFRMLGPTMSWPMTSYVSGQNNSMAVGGETSAQALAALPGRMALWPQAPNVALISVGTNDLKSSSDYAAIKGNIEAIRDTILASYPDCQIFVMLLAPVDPTGTGPYVTITAPRIAPCNAVLATVTGVAILDGNSGFPYPTGLLSDGTHWSTLGADFEAGTFDAIISW